MKYLGIVLFLVLLTLAVGCTNEKAAGPTPIAQEKAAATSEVLPATVAPTVPAPTNTPLPPPPPPTDTPVPPPPPPPPPSDCSPCYPDVCLKVGAGDYDCAGGSGNGPNYTGRVRVVGCDPFDLDRDNDGWGCE